jgi:hypothetical protein
MTSISPIWDAHKDLLSNLYRDQNWSQESVAKHMETHHGFVRRLVLGHEVERRLTEVAAQVNTSVNSKNGDGESMSGPKGGAA